MKRRGLSSRMLWLTCWYATGSKIGRRAKSHGRVARDETRP